MSKGKIYDKKICMEVEIHEHVELSKGRGAGKLLKANNNFSHWPSSCHHSAHVRNRRQKHIFVLNGLFGIV